MDLVSLGRLIATRRRAQGLTLAALAEAAGIGRSTLAALESGRLPELGFNKVARICAAAGILLETRPPLLDRSQMLLPQLTDTSGSDFTREAIVEVIGRGDIRAWQALARTVQTEESGRLADRVRRVIGALPRDERDDPRVLAFVALLPGMLRNAIARDAERPRRFASYRVKLPALTFK